MSSKCLLSAKVPNCKKIFDVYKIWQNGRGDFEELNFETESEHWFEKLLRLAL